MFHVIKLFGTKARHSVYCAEALTQESQVGSTQASESGTLKNYDIIGDMLSPSGQSQECQGKFAVSRQKISRSGGGALR